MNYEYTQTKSELSYTVLVSFIHTVNGHRTETDEKSHRKDIINVEPPRSVREIA